MRIIRQYLSAFWVAVRLLLIKLGLSLLGVNTTQAVLSRLAKFMRRERPDPTLTQMRNMAAFIGTVAGRLPINILCLPQSMLLTYLLRRDGQPVTLHIGVTDPADFAAHAWVECDGTTISEPGDPDNNYRKIIEF